MMRGTGVFEDTLVSGVTVVGSIGAAIGDAAVVTVEVVVIAAMVVITGLLVVVIRLGRIGEDEMVEVMGTMIVVVVGALDEIGGGSESGGDEIGEKNVCWTGAFVGKVDITGGAGEGTRIGEFCDVGTSDGGVIGLVVDRD